MARADNETSEQPVKDWIVRRYRKASHDPKGYGRPNSPRSLRYSLVKSGYVHRLLSREDVDSSGLVLELGVGTGLIALPLARYGYRIVGCDLSPDMLCRARTRKREEDSAYPLLVRANGLRLPFPENTFSAAYAMQVFHLFPYPVRQQLANELLRVLRPNGTLVVDYLQRWSHLIKHLKSRRSRPYRYETARNVTRPFGHFSQVHVHGGVLPLVWRFLAQKGKGQLPDTAKGSWCRSLSDAPGLRQVTHSLMVVARK